MEVPGYFHTLIKKDKKKNIKKVLIENIQKKYEIIR